MPIDADRSSSSRAWMDLSSYPALPHAGSLRHAAATVCECRFTRTTTIPTLTRSSRRSRPNRPCLPAGKRLRQRAVDRIGSALVAPEASAGASRRWVFITLLGAATFINYLDRGSLAVALPFISRELHL